MDDKLHPLLVILRWIAFIPGGILIGCLASALIIAIFGGNGAEDAPILGILSTFGGFFGVSVGARIAPCHSKTGPGIVLATLFVIFGGISIVFAVQDRSWIGVIGGVCLIVATVIGAIATIKKWV